MKKKTAQDFAKYQPGERHIVIGSSCFNPSRVLEIKSVFSNYTIENKFFKICIVVDHVVYRDSARNHSEEKVDTGWAPAKTLTIAVSA